MYNLHIARTILNYLPKNISKNKIKYGRNVFVRYDKNIINEKDEIICDLSIVGFLYNNEILHCLSVTFGNTQMVLIIKPSYNGVYVINVYYIKRNFRKTTGIDSLEKREMEYYKKYNLIRNLVDSLEHNIRLIYPKYCFGDTHYHHEISHRRKTQTIFYRFIVEIV